MKSGNFNKVGEGIYKATGAVSKEDCDYIYDYIYKQANNPVDNLGLVPWDDENSNVLYYPIQTDRKLLDILNKHKSEMTPLVTELYQEVVYPHLTTVVLWKPGQKMPRHVDNGHGSDEQHLSQLGMRAYTTIAYMNDDFDGGYTYIRSDGKSDPNYRADPSLLFPNPVFEDFMSKPEQGAVVAFKADDTNAHGVSELLNGTRVVLSVWYTTDSMYQEQIR
jgi:hypothetical protein